MGAVRRSLVYLLTLISVAATLSWAGKIDKETKYIKKYSPVLKEHKKTENIFKKLEYQSLNADTPPVDGVVAVDLNLLPDTRLALDIEDSLNEEFELIDKELGDAPGTPTDSENNENPDSKSSKFRNNRQMSLMYQGVYVPDSRFNAFVDGVMVNMVVEMRRKKMDPLYFRVYDRGVIEHVPTRTSRGGRTSTESRTNTTRTGRQRNRGTAIGGGVVRGLTKVKRFGNAEVQVAGNTTLVRIHSMFGPINIELVFETPDGAKVINSTISALAGHSLAEYVSMNSSSHREFFIDSPVDYQIDLVGAKNRRYRSLSKSAILRLFKEEGRMEKRLRQCLMKAYEKPIVDVTKSNKRNSRSKKKNKSERREKRQKRINNRNRNGEARGVSLNMESTVNLDQVAKSDDIGSTMGIRS